MTEHATGVDRVATMRQIAQDALRSGMYPSGVLARGVINLADEVGRLKAKVERVRGLMEPEDEYDTPWMRQLRAILDGD